MLPVYERFGSAAHCCKSLFHTGYSGREPAALAKASGLVFDTFRSPLANAAGSLGPMKQAGRTTISTIHLVQKLEKMLRQI
jgi:hypothetical protein